MMSRGPGQRRRSDKLKALARQQSPLMAAPLLTAGSQAALRWLSALPLTPTRRWHVLVTIVGTQRARFDLNVYAEEWGYRFTHGGRVSWIRVTDIPFVHGRDDHGLLNATPDLMSIGGLLATLEARHGIALRGRTARVRSNIADATEAVRTWLAAQ